MKRSLSLACALALILSLSACGGSGMTAMDAADYVQGILDQTYLGVFHEDYMESVGIDETQARASYEKGLDVEYQYFTYCFDMDTQYLTEETKEAILDLLADLYRQSGYQVKTAERHGDGFAVEVEVEPIDLIPLIAENYMEDYSAQFAAAYADVHVSAEEEEAFLLTYENDWAMGIVELFRAHEAELGHLEAESIIVQVKPDGEGVYSLSDTDFSNIDALILAYSYR